MVEIVRKDTAKQRLPDGALHASDPVSQQNLEHPQAPLDQCCQGLRDPEELQHVCCKS